MKYEFPTGKIVYGLSYGDEGKGAVVAALASSQKFDFGLRYNGGPNAGHTIYVDNKKVVTHQVPTSTIFGIPGHIGPSCVVDPKKLLKEISDLESLGFKIRCTVSPRAHIITTDHIEKDSANDLVGTTRSGIGPTYADKALRVGLRAEDCKELEHLVDVPALVSSGPLRWLCEGAQGIGLDIDLGDYPYVSSSSAHPGAVANCGIPPYGMRRIGVCKIYDTYVGSKPFAGGDPVLIDLARLGDEYGATTGRPRQVNWLDLTQLEQHIIWSAPDAVIINKCDILEELGVFRFFHNKTLYEANSISEMMNILRSCLSKLVENIYFSSTPGLEEEILEELECL